MSNSNTSKALSVAGLIGLVAAILYAGPADAKLLAGGSAILGSIVLLAIHRTSSAPTGPALSAEEWREFPLMSKEQISPNTAVYRFKLPSPTMALGLPIGQHISIRARIDGKDVQRSYTPISSDDDLGHFDLLVKSYPQGNLSKMFSELKLGDTISVKGPKGQFKYQPNMCRAIGMIAGGTGITPMLQVIRAVLKNPEDKTHITLLFANVAVQDILLKDQLDELANKSNGRFNVHYVLNQPPENWSGSVGFVTKELIAKYLPKAAPDTKVLLCGPPPMIKAMTAYTEELGYQKAQTISKAADQVFKF